MCRWLAYSGDPIRLETLIFEPEHSLIDQSLSARSGETTNGDGFGIGWYGDRPTPGVFKDVRPAWNDPNLLDLSAQIRSGLFLAHVRAATPGLTVQRSNCHPFRFGRWLLVHNGSIRGFPGVRRQLLDLVADDLFPAIEGSTDSELLFFLALTHGLEEDPVAAMERAVGIVEDLGRQRGEEHPLMMSVGITDGERLWAIRYSSEGESRSLYTSEHHGALAEIHPEAGRFPPGARVVVSEPLTDLPDGWREVPESTAVIIRGGESEERAFRPRTADRSGN